MAILEQAYGYLSRIMSKEETFVTIMNRSIPNAGLSSEDTTLLRDVLKSAVNKYYFLRFEVRKGAQEIELESEETNVLILGLAFIHYVKNVDFDLVMKFFEEEYGSLPLRISLDQIKQIYSTIGDHPMDLPSRVEEVISKKVSLKYSYPEWIVKMMFKHFGVKNTFRSAASSRHGMPIVINTNDMKLKNEELDETLYSKTKFSSRAYNYLGKEKIIQQSLFKSNKIFVEDEAEQMLINLLDPQQGENLLCIDDSRGIMALDACLRMNDMGKVNAACSDLIALEAAKNLTRRFGVKSVAPFESNAKLLITHVEPNTMDKVLVVPKSSEIGLVRKHPDVLLTLKRGDLDGIIEEEVQYLEEAKQFVKPEGILLYSVFTLNKKESENIIHEFLEKNQNFELIEEKQIFPFEGPTDGFYYAKMKKTEEKNEN